jgi:hypothetical protein
MAERVIICRCGQWNLVKDREARKGFFKCDGCRKRLSTTGLPPPHPATRRALILFVLLPLIGAGLIGAYAFVPDARRTLSALIRLERPADTGSLPSALPAPRPVRVEEPKPVLQPVTIKTGTIRTKIKGRTLAIFAVEADDSNYALRVIEKKANTEILKIFIASKQMFETKIPLGTYRILGARGDVWYGEQHLFGPSTSYFAIRKSKSNGPPGKSLPGDDEFALSQTGNTINGLRIMLRSAVGGTITTDPISAGEFQQ